MFWPTFEKLQLSPDQLRPYGGCLYGFAGDQVEVRGYIELRTTFTDSLVSCTEKIRYLVVNAPSAYNILLGRPTLNRKGVVPSTRHMKVNLPSMEGMIITIRSDQNEAKKCYENSSRTRDMYATYLQCRPLAWNMTGKAGEIWIWRWRWPSRAMCSMCQWRILRRGPRALPGDRQGVRYREGADRQREEASAGGGMA